MKLNVFHVRAAMAIAGVMLMVAYLASGGSFGSKSTVLIEFGMYPREFQGCEVEIDGKVVGRLTMFGQASRTAFSVKDGKHVLRVLSPEWESQAFEFEAGAGARDVHLILDFVGERNGKPLIGFQ
jgi:hypothetical protein